MEHMQIIKLPFIDLDVLEKAYSEGAHALESSKSDYDKNRNKTSADLLFEFDKETTITIPVFNYLVHKTKIENANVGVFKFNHLDAVLPEKVTTLTVDMEKKNAERKQFEEKRNFKKNTNQEGSENYEKKGKYHKKREGDDDEEAEE